MFTQQDTIFLNRTIQTTTIDDDDDTLTNVQGFLILLATPLSKAHKQTIIRMMVGLPVVVYPVYPLSLWNILDNKLDNDVETMSSIHSTSTTLTHVYIFTFIRLLLRLGKIMIIIILCYVSFHVEKMKDGKHHRCYMEATTSI